MLKVAKNSDQPKKFTFSEALDRHYMDNDSKYEVDNSDNRWEPDCDYIGK